MTTKLDHSVYITARGALLRYTSLSQVINPMIACKGLPSLITRTVWRFLGNAWETANLFSIFGFKPVIVGKSPGIMMIYRGGQLVILSQSDKRVEIALARRMMPVCVDHVD